jgi:hypothetical protein
MPNAVLYQKSLTNRNKQPPSTEIVCHTAPRTTTRFNWKRGLQMATRPDRAPLATTNPYGPRDSSDSRLKLARVERRGLWSPLAALPFTSDSEVRSVESPPLPGRSSCCSRCSSVEIRPGGVSLAACGTHESKHASQWHSMRAQAGALRGVRLEGHSADRVWLLRSPVMRL